MDGLYLSVSGKTEKAIRKLAKKELEKRMQPNGQQQQQINILAELSQFIASFQLLTGEKPASITIINTMYNMYVQVAQNNAEALGLNPGFKTGEPTFQGVKIEKKSPLIVPTSNTQIPSPATSEKTN